MSVIGHWRRSALGAGGVALLLPLGLTLGVALTAALGGESTLRALGQVFAGPSAPARERAPGLESARDVPSVPVRRPSPVAPVSPGAAVTEPDTTPAEPEPDPGPAPADPDPQPADPDPPVAGVPPATEDTPPAEPPPGSALHETGQAVADIVAEVPVAGGAMQTVVDLIP